jgi:methionyl-tRNA formyltransferase
MKVEEGLDTGPVYAVRAVALDDEIGLTDLRHQLVGVASEMVVDALAGGWAGLPEPRPQEGEATRADKVTREDLHLRWEEAAVQLRRVVRLERAWTTFRGKRLGVLRASCETHEGVVDAAPPGTLIGTAVATGRGTLHLVTVQPESRSPMSAEEWVRGIRAGEGERLGSD